MSTTTITRRRAVKYRAYPTKGQANLIDRTIGCARLVYNLMLETRIASYQSRFGMPDAQGKAFSKARKSSDCPCDAPALVDLWKHRLRSRYAESSAD